MFLRRITSMHLDLEILTKKQKQKQKFKKKIKKNKTKHKAIREWNDVRDWGQGCEVENVSVSGMLIYVYWLVNVIFVSFSADVGGTMGLFLGCSLLTLFEFFDLLIIALFRCYAAKKSASRKITHESEAYHDPV